MPAMPRAASLRLVALAATVSMPWRTVLASARTADACARLRAEGRLEEVRRKTGLVLDPYFSGTKLGWLFDHVDGLRAKAARGERHGYDAASIKERAALLLRLSSLTLPHALVRVLLAEALYRAVSLARGHPYHRE